MALILDKIDSKAVTRYGHNIMIKGSKQQEDITIINIYTLNIRTPIYIRKHWQN